LREEFRVANGFALAAAHMEKVCGYAFFRMCFPESELVHLLVAPEWRRHQVATALLAQAMVTLASQSYRVCFLEVRASNIAARRLYAQVGFVQTGIRKQYYRHPVEDALLLSRDIFSTGRN
jgi:ribosomal-protein-alanine N-acetyltransferase